MGMRVTTGMAMNSYRYNLQNSTSRLNNSRNTVLTQRKFNSYGEAPAAATQAWRLRRSLVNADIYQSNNKDTYTRFNIAWLTLGQASYDLTNLDGQSSAIYAANDPTGAGRNALGQVLRQTAESVVQTMNSAKSGEHFLFSGDDELNAPFSWGKDLWGNETLFYRGVDVNSGKVQSPADNPVPDRWGSIDSTTGLPSKMPSKITNPVDQAWADYYKTNAAYQKAKAASAAYAEAKTAYDKADEAYTAAGTALSDAKTNLKAGTISQDEYDEIEAAYNEAAATRKDLAADLDKASENYDSAMSAYVGEDNQAYTDAYKDAVVAYDKAVDAYDALSNAQTALEEAEKALADLEETDPSNTEALAAAQEAVEAAQTAVDEAETAYGDALAGYNTILENNEVLGTEPTEFPDAPAELELTEEYVAENPAEWQGPPDSFDLEDTDDYGTPNFAFQVLNGTIPDLDEDGEPRIGEDGKPVYREATPAEMAWAAYYYDQGNVEKLNRMSKEEVPVDLGMGMLEDVDGKLVDGTYYNRALPGINMLGFGIDEDGDPQNVCMIMKRLAEIYESCDSDTGAYASDADREEAMRLIDKLKAGQSYVSGQYVEVGAKSSFLEQNQSRLELQTSYLNEQLLEIEDVDLADAISQFTWDYYCYSAALKVGTQLLSQSLIDYMS